jgi:predicted Zn-dependent peptidase
MDERQYERFGERLYAETLENGLRVFLLPKPGFSQVYATFTTHYGSIDRTFRRSPSEPFTTVPDGIAHFLEHKMFESEEGDIFSEFAKHGASANAFTTFDHTTYLFSCTEDVLENTVTLLDFVQHPYFTDETVEKEKGIIGQEIRMYDDNPDWRAFFGLLKALFHEHPVRIDIAGTVESIGEITKDTLYRCYETFYHPSNMVFFAAGGFDANEMIETIRQNQLKKSFPPSPAIERQFPKEPATVKEAKTAAHLSVVQPRCLIGWKDQVVGKTGRDLLEQEQLTGVILDCLFGRSSPLYHALIDEGVIDQQFSWEYEITPSYGYSLVGGNTPDPDRLLEEIERSIQKAIADGLQPDEFERARKKSIGRFMSSLDSPNYLARSFTSYYLKGADLFDIVPVLEGLTLEQANRRLKEHFLADARSVSLVLPKK